MKQEQRIVERAPQWCPATFSPPPLSLFGGQQETSLSPLTTHHYHIYRRCTSFQKSIGPCYFSLLLLLLLLVMVSENLSQLCQHNNNNNNKQENILRASRERERERESALVRTSFSFVVLASQFSSSLVS